MANFGKTQPNYIRKLTKNGATVQLTLPTALVRSSDFAAVGYTVLSAAGPDRITLQTLDSWMKERRQ